MSSNIIGGVLGGGLTVALVASRIANRITEVENKVRRLKDLKWAIITDGKLIYSDGQTVNTSDPIGDFMKDDNLMVGYLHGKVYLENDVVLELPNKIIVGYYIKHDRFFIKEVDKSFITSRIVRPSGARIIVRVPEDVDGVVRRVSPHLDGILIDGLDADSEVDIPDNVYTAGPAIEVVQTRGLWIREVHVHRNEYGIKIGPAASVQRGNGNIIIRDVTATYNVYGLWTMKGGWLSYLDIDGFRSYLNQKHALYIDMGYALVVRNVDSEADNWAAPVAGDPLNRQDHAAVYIAPKTAMIDNVAVHMGYGNTPGYVGIHLSGWNGGVYQMSNIMVEGVQYEGINTLGPDAPDEYYIYLTNFYIGWMPTRGETSRGFINTTVLGQAPGVHVRNNAFGSITNGLIVTNETTKISVPAGVTTAGIVTR